MRKTSTNTKIILTKNVSEVGNKGQKLEVKTGYFRNFLAPNGFAVEVTKSTSKMIAKQETESKKKFERDFKKTKGSVAKLEGTVFEFSKKAQKDGSLYGSVTVEEMKRSIETLIGVEIPHAVMESFKPIKSAGEHSFEVEFFEGEKINVKVSVNSEEVRKKEEPKKKK